MKTPEVFISYLYSDEPSRHFAAALTERLHARNVSVWQDKLEIKPGTDWRDSIERALEQAETFVFLLSPRALQSPWTNFELGVAASRAAASRDVHIIPVVLAGALSEKLPHFLRDRVVIDVNERPEDRAAEEVAQAVASASGDLKDQGPLPPAEEGSA
jgi:hypothetical protein